MAVEQQPLRLINVITGAMSSIVGLALGARTDRPLRRPAAHPLPPLPWKDQLEIAILKGRQRRVVLVGLDRLTETGLIHPFQRGEGRLLHEIADRVDPSNGQNAAHGKLLSLWTSLSARSIGIGSSLETAAIDSEIASIQSLIEQLWYSTRTPNDR